MLCKNMIEPGALLDLSFEYLILLFLRETEYSTKQSIFIIQNIDFHTFKSRISKILDNLEDIH